MKMQPRPDLVPLRPGFAARQWQTEAARAIAEHLRVGTKRMLVAVATGCHAPGQKVMRHDGSLVTVEDVVVGDLLMGPDSTPRRVLSLTSGHDEMFRIVPVKGEPWVVNGDHILSLVDTRDGTDERLVDVTVREWMRWGPNAKHLHKLVRAPVEYPPTPADARPISPYHLGMLIGDGCLGTSWIGVTKPDPEIREACAELAEAFGLKVSEYRSGGDTPHFRLAKVSRKGRPRSNPLTAAIASLGLRVGGEHRFIPAPYLYAPRGDRLALLAGLLDTDGSLTCGGYDWLSKSQRLAVDIATLARGLGLAAKVVQREIRTNFGGGTYWRVTISGDCSAVPTRIPRKKAHPRQQIKSVLRTGFKVEPVGVGPFYGFTVDGDHRYLLDDFTITHNCGKGDLLASMMVKAAWRGRRVGFAVHRDFLLSDVHARALDIEPALYAGCIAGRVNEPDRHAIFASLQTVRNAERAAQIGALDYLFLDEAHWMLCASGFAMLDTLLGINPNMKVIGFTATPFRAAGAGRTSGLGPMFGPDVGGLDAPIYEYGLADGIRDGVLSPMEAKRLEPLYTRKPDDEDGRKIADLLDTDAHNDAVVDAYLRHRAPGIAFCASVPHAIHLAERFKRAGVKAEAVWDSSSVRDPATKEVIGKDKDRDRKIAAIQSGELEVVTNLDLLSTGFDCRRLEVMMSVRPTGSPGLFAQQVGRVTRLSPETGKRRGLVLDFVDNTVMHNLAFEADLSTPEKKERTVDPGDVVKHRFDPARSEGLVTATEDEGRIATVEWRGHPTNQHSADELILVRKRRERETVAAVPAINGLQEFSIELIRGNREAGWYFHESGVAGKTWTVSATLPWLREVCLHVWYYADNEQPGWELWRVWTEEDETYGKFTTSIVVSEGHATPEDACEHAAQWLKGEGGRFLPATASWKSRPSTPQQHNRLRYYGKRSGFERLTRGEASALGDALMCVRTIGDELNPERAARREAMRKKYAAAKEVAPPQEPDLTHLFGPSWRHHIDNGEAAK